MRFNTTRRSTKNDALLATAIYPVPDLYQVAKSQRGNDYNLSNQSDLK